MPSNCIKTIKKLALKFLLLAGVLALLDVVYRFTLYPKDLEANCTLMQRSMMPVEQNADVVYLGARVLRHLYRFREYLPAAQSKPFTRYVEA